MICFDNFIGIKSCDLVDSKSGLYLEDLGISIVKLAAISNEANLTGVRYGQDKINQALNYVINDIGSDYNDTPLVGSLNEHADAFTTYSGVINLRSTCKDTKIFIENVRAKAQTDIDTILYVKDGSTITEFPFNTADEVVLNYQSVNREIEIYINDVNYIPAVVYQNCMVQDACCDNLTYYQGQTGLEVDYQLKCVDLECRLSVNKSFQQAVLYYTAVLIAQDLRLSENFNEIVTFRSASKEDEREDLLMATYEKYAEKAKSYFIQLIDKSCCKACDKVKVIWNF